MRLSLVALILLVLTSLSAFAADDHSENVCSVLNAEVCGHIGHMSGMRSDIESQFVTHLEIPGEVQVTNLKIILWMPSMGHGSSPVAVSQFGVNKYKITQAYFIMPGAWEVRVSFVLDGVQHQLNIPVQISQ